MLRKSFPLLAAAALGAAASPAFALSVVTSLTNQLAASPPQAVGRCPVEIIFHGRVIVRGNFQPGSSAEIGYQFTRSDGATGQNQYIEASHPGVYDVVDTWTLGGSSVPHYAGWEQFHTWPTDSQQGGGHVTAISNQAHFTLTCRLIPEPPRPNGQP